MEGGIYWGWKLGRVIRGMEKGVYVSGFVSWGEEIIEFGDGELRGKRGKIIMGDIWVREWINVGMGK